MHTINTRKLTKHLNQALRRSWVIIQEQERNLANDETFNDATVEYPTDELIRTVEQFLVDIKATRTNTEKTGKLKQFRYKDVK